MYILCLQHLLKIDIYVFDVFLGSKLISIMLKKNPDINANYLTIVSHPHPKLKYCH